MAQVAEVITIDRDADAAYIRFSRDASVRTEALNEFLNVDLDSSYRVVGVELLSLDEEIPFGDLAAKYHLPADFIESLKEQWFAS